jgi:hypothetical protein
MGSQIVGGDIVLYTKRGVGPEYAFEYEGCAEFDDADLAPGELTPITCRSNAAYRETVVIDIARGESGMPSTTIRLLLRQAQWLMEQGRACPMTVDYRFGMCGRPDNPEDWSEILRFNGAYVQPGSVNTGAGQADKVQVSANVGGMTYTMLYSLTLDAVDVGDQTAGLDAVLVVPKAECSGDCGPGFGVCDYVFVATEGEYLTTAEVIYTADGGSTWEAMAVSPFAAGESISCMVGDVTGSATGTTMRLVVFRGTTDGANPAECAITTDWGATWAAVEIGAVNGQYVTAAFRRGRKIWAGCDDGYLYYSANFGNTWALQSSGTVTGAINSICMFSDSVGMAVCDGDEGLVTADGSTWSALGDVADGSDPDLLCVWMTTQWIAYCGTDAGTVYYSLDRGVTWTLLQTLGTDPVRDIQFWTDTTGYVLYGNTVYRTVDAVEFVAQTTPTAAVLRDLDLCGPNSGWAVGQTSANADLAVHFQPQPATPIY